MFEPSLLADYATPTTLAGLLFGALLGAAGMAFLSQLISRNRSWRAFFTFTIVSFTAFCLLVLGVVWFTPAPTGAILKAQVRSLYTPAADKGTQLSSMQNPSMLQALLVEWAVNRSTRSGPGEPTFAEVQRSKNLGSAAEIEAALPDPGTLQTKALLGNTRPARPASRPSEIRCSLMKKSWQSGQCRKIRSSLPNRLDYTAAGLGSRGAPICGMSPTVSNRADSAPRPLEAALTKKGIT
jgi:hypothetical protein